MGFYAEQVLPRFIDFACGTSAMRPWRQEAAQDLKGQVVEIGFGSGLNLAHYPDGVERVLAVEPATVAKKLAEKRVIARGIPVRNVGLDGQQLPLDDDTCDSALATFTLCTVPDPEAALAELARVLRPGGSFHFVEHGLSPDPKVAAWQHRIEPWYSPLAGGCRLTRDVPALVREAGFHVESCRQEYAPGPKPWSWFSIGVALKPGP